MSLGSQKAPIHRPKSYHDQKKLTKYAQIRFVHKSRVFVFTRDKGNSLRSIQVFHHWPQGRKNIIKILHKVFGNNSHLRDLRWRHNPIRSKIIFRPS